MTINVNRVAMAALLTGCLLATSGCILALGAAGAAGGYEYHQAKEMDELEADYEAGRISREEFLARKKQIEQTAVFQ